MPELPEVETVKNLLNKIVINRTIQSIDVLRSSNIEGDPTTFTNTLIGKTFINVTIALGSKRVRIMRVCKISRHTNSYRRLL